MIKIINTHFVLFWLSDAILFDAKTLLKPTDGFDSTSNYQADTQKLFCYSMSSLRHSSSRIWNLQYLKRYFLSVIEAIVKNA